MRPTLVLLPSPKGIETLKKIASAVSADLADYLVPGKVSYSLRYDAIELSYTVVQRLRANGYIADSHVSHLTEKGQAVVEGRALTKSQMAFAEKIWDKRGWFVLESPQERRVANTLVEKKLLLKTFNITNDRDEYRWVGE